VLLLVVWIVVVVLAVVVLGGIAYGLFGALSRLGREVEGAQRELRPLLTDVQATLAAVERSRQNASDAG
jgi:hypothetical protein